MTEGMITIYGIKNCDKCRAAQKWFAGRDIDFTFHDLRVNGLSEGLYKNWQKTFDDGRLLNRRSQTWRSIPKAERENLTVSTERELALRYPTLVKRPIVASDTDLRVGYDEAAWEDLL